jgi:lysophospholipase L1-like esterase
MYIYRASSKIDPFDQPFCDPGDGTCHEKPNQPSPRTIYSAWNKQQYDRWWKFYNTLNDRAIEYATKRTELLKSQKQRLENESFADATIPRALILLGDSITESWLGTGSGVPNPRTEGIPQVLQDELVTKGKLDPLVLAISGDQTQHLLYRLHNGHLQSAYTTEDPSAVFVVMIGTNNLGAGELPGPTADGVLAVVEYLLRVTQESQNQIMLFQILPRGDGRTWLPKLCPPRCQLDGKPYTSFLPPIKKVNEAVQDGITKLNTMYKSKHSTKHDERVTFVDCGKEFLSTDKDDLEVKQEELMPDLLHPNAKGHKILARCILDFIEHHVRR